MNTEQERADFEAWLVVSFPGIRIERLEDQRYVSLEAHFMFEAYQAGRAALQSRGPAEQALAELVDKIVPGLDTGDLLADAQKASAALQSQDREDAERLTWLEDKALRSRSGISIDYRNLVEDGCVTEKGFRFMSHRFIGGCFKTIRGAIDHARRIEGADNADI